MQITFEVLEDHHRLLEMESRYVQRKRMGIARDDVHRGVSVVIPFAIFDSIRSMMQIHLEW